MAKPRTTSQGSDDQYAHLFTIIIAVLTILVSASYVSGNHQTAAMQYAGHNLSNTWQKVLSFLASHVLGYHDRSATGFDYHILALCFTVVQGVVAMAVSLFDGGGQRRCRNLLVRGAAWNSSLAAAFYAVAEA